jgi:hypothetical protein
MPRGQSVLLTREAPPADSKSATGNITAPCPAPEVRFERSRWKCCSAAALTGDPATGNRRPGGAHEAFSSIESSTNRLYPLGQRLEPCRNRAKPLPVRLDTGRTPLQPPWQSLKSFRHARAAPLQPLLVALDPLAVTLQRLSSPKQDTPAALQPLFVALQPLSVTLDRLFAALDRLFVQIQCQRIQLLELVCGNWKLN